MHYRRESEVDVSNLKDDSDFENENTLKIRKKVQESPDLSQEVYFGTIVYQPDKYNQEIEERVEE